MNCYTRVIRTFCVAAALLLSGTSATAQTAPAMYEAVLRYMQQQDPARSVVLYDTILKQDCIKGGCEEPWAGSLPQSWLEQARSKGLIRGFCAYRSGFCADSAGEPAAPAGAVVVQLTTPRSCGRACAEVLAIQSLSSSPGSATLLYVLYRLTCGREGWSVTSASELATGYQN